MSEVILADNTRDGMARAFNLSSTVRLYRHMMDDTPLAWLHDQAAFRNVTQRYLYRRQQKATWAD